MKKQRAKPRALSAERVLDVLLDISIRHRRESQDSVSKIFKDNHVDQSLHQDLLHVGFLRREGKRNVYTGMIPTLEIADAVLDAYRERTQSMDSAYEEEETTNESTELMLAVREMSQVLKALYKELTGRSLILRHESQQEEKAGTEASRYNRTGSELPDD